MRLACFVLLLTCSGFVQASTSPVQNADAQGEGMPVVTLLKNYVDSQKTLAALKDNTAQVKKLSKQQAIQLVNDTEYPVVALNQSFVQRNPYWPAKSSEPFPKDFHECYTSRFNDASYRAYRSAKITEAFEKGHADSLITQVSFLESRQVPELLKKIYVVSNQSIADSLDMLINPPPELLARMPKDAPAFKLEDEFDLFTSESTISSTAQDAFDYPAFTLSPEFSERVMLLRAIDISPEFDELRKVLILDHWGVFRELNAFNTHIFNQCESAHVK
jgi:hypothetical protein